jgi:hypothetical protein
VRSIKGFIISSLKQINPKDLRPEMKRRRDRKSQKEKKSHLKIQIK